MKTFFLTLFLFSAGITFSQVTYDVYVLQFGGPFRMLTKQAAVNSTSTDTLHACYMVWLLKGSDGKNILIDAGFSDSTKAKNFIRPDRVIQNLG